MIFKGKRSFEHVTTYPLTQLTYQEAMLKSIEMTHALQARQATKVMLLMCRDADPDNVAAGGLGMNPI